MIDDEKIIELFFERSEQGIRELDMKYGKICHNLSYNIVNSRRDAEECVNDAYLGAWNAIPPVHPNPLLSYIVKIVRNISLKTYWRKEAAKRSGHYTVALEEIEGCIADQKTVEDEIEARELARIIEAFLDTLTAKERVIFMRRYGCLWTGQGNGRGLPLSYESGACFMSRAPAGFETFCPEVPVKTRASTFAVLAFVISEIGGILCTHRPNTKAK